MNTSKVCVVNQLTKIYAHNNKVLDDLSIEINKGEIVSINYPIQSIVWAYNTKFWQCCHYG